MNGTYFSFPFAQIGQALRALSLSGGVGNVAAWILYVLVGFIPCAVFFWLLWKKKWHKTDLFLPALSVLLFVTIFYMINPGLFQANMEGEAGMLLGAAFDSVLCTYLVLRVLFLCGSAEADCLHKGLMIVLYAAIVFLLVVIAAECGVRLPQAMQTIRSGNSTDGFQTVQSTLAGSGAEALTLTYIFCVLHTAVNVLLYVLDIVVLRMVIRFSKTFHRDAWSEETSRNVERLSRYCTVNLAVSVVGVMVFNLLQLVFHRRLYQIDMVVVVPVFSVLLVLAIWMLAEYMRKNQALKQENDLFI